MDKNQFYIIGFYSLIMFNIGVVTGTVINPTVVKKEYVTTVQQDTAKAVKDTVTALNDTSLMRELKKNKVSHPEIVLAQAKLETGHYKSKVCRSNNNLFGLMKGNSYHKFSHWKESVKYYKEHVQSRYKGGDYYAFLNEIGYAEDPSYTDKLKDMI